MTPNLAGRILRRIGLIGMFLAASQAGAVERAVEMIETPGRAALLECTNYIFISRCDRKTVSLPKRIWLGDRLKIHVEGKVKPVQFDVRWLRGDPKRALCWIGDDYGHRRGNDYIVVRNCRIVPPAEARKAGNIRRLAGLIEFLGSTAGVAEVCARSPKLDAKTSLEWSGRSIALYDLAQRYIERLAPSDETAETAATIAMHLTAADQHENPERVWNDPQGCRGSVAKEVTAIIAAAKACLVGNHANAVFFADQFRCLR